MTLTVSLAQIAFEFGDPEENLERVKQWLPRAQEAGADLLLFPELWASGFDLKDSERYASPLGEGVFREMSDLARQYGMAIGGSNLERDEGKIYNTFTLHDQDGSLLTYYRKIHLFRLLEEERWLAAGEEMVKVDTRWGAMGLSTCYDLRFPEIFRAYALAGVKLILLVAEWPEKRIHHWWKLLQARAIENQVFIAAVNKVGVSQGEVLGGHSAVLDPWGEPVVSAENGEHLLTAEIDLERVEKARAWIPILGDRNPGAYDRMRGRE